MDTVINLNDIPRWSQLSARQRGLIANGCGGKGGWLKPPSFRFNANCDQHDFYYWRGGTEEDRKTADKEFLVIMLEDANRGVWWKRAWYRWWANTYYVAVRLFGKKFFHYRVTKATWRELYAEIGHDPEILTEQF